MQLEISHILFSDTVEVLIYKPNYRIPLNAFPVQKNKWRNLNYMLRPICHPENIEKLGT